MFHWILTIFTLVVSLFGLFAFVKLMLLKQEVASVSLVSMEEMKTLNPELKAFYRKYAVDRIFPAVIKMVNKGYIAARESMTYSKIDAELKNQTDALVDSINSLSDTVTEKVKESTDTKEAFQTMVQQLRR